MGIYTNRTMNVQAVFITLLMMATMCLGVTVDEQKPKKPLVPPGGAEKERIMTWEEKVKFDKFKRLALPHAWRDDLKNDLFILRWLRAKHLDIDLAMTDFLAMKKFYFDNNIETISDELWNDFDHDFPVHHAVDREGRPVAYLYLREGWDLRAAILQGKKLRMERYLVKIVFELLIRLRDANWKDPNVTQFTILINLDGFSLIQQGCPLCLQSLISLLDIYERFLPGFSKEIIIVEAPTTWKYFYQIIRPVLSDHTQNAIKMFNTNKSRWMPYIHRRVDPRQLPHYFGGTKKEENLK